MIRVIYVFLVVLLAWPVPASAGSSQSWQQQLEAAEPVKGSPITGVHVAGKVTVVTFFASWCPPCRNEFVHLNKVRAEHGGDGLAIVAVNLFENWGGKENPARMARFIGLTKPQFALVRGNEEMRVTFGNIERIPSLIVFDAGGREVWRFVHERGSIKTHATARDIKAALKAAGLATN
jgi:cytochrome c biogenesis protein CcmG/thiol:disulfide interchange protein DsbE